MTCVFCKIVSGEIPAEILHENEHVICIRDAHPVTSGHSLVIPKKHVTDLFETDGKLWREVNGVAKMMADKIRDELKADGMNIISSHGKDAGQSVFHLHVHVVPRHKGDGHTLWFN